MAFLPISPGSQIVELNLQCRPPATARGILYDDKSEAESQSTEIGIKDNLGQLSDNLQTLCEWIRFLDVLCYSTARHISINLIILHWSIFHK